MRQATGHDTNSGREIAVALNINGLAHTRMVLPAMTLLEFVRDEINLTGTKRGCDLGECGCCTVLIDGKPALSCITLAADVQGQSITTIEGLACGPDLHPVQTAFVEKGALQCGFCTPAMILNAAHLLSRESNPSRAEIKTAISGTICRCTGYTKIEEAIDLAANVMRRDGGGAK